MLDFTVDADDRPLAIGLHIVRPGAKRLEPACHELGRNIGTDILQNIQISVCDTGQRIADHGGNDTFAARRGQCLSGFAMRILDRGDDFPDFGNSLHHGSPFSMARCLGP